MSQTSIVICGTGATNGSGTAWSNPTRITADDGSTASCTSSKTRYLVGTNYNFASRIPDYAVITGIEVQIEARFQVAALSPRIYGIQLRKNGALFGAEVTVNQPLTNVLTKYLFGGIGSLWGNNSITRDDVIDSTFGFGWWGREQDGVSSATYHSDASWMRIYYTISGGEMRTNKRPWRGRV